MNVRLRSFLCCAVAASAAVMAMPSAYAQYYWDNDGSTLGFGTASGTWTVPTTGNSTQGWSTSSNGTVTPTDYTTTTSDSLNFGTSAFGLGAGTINVSGTVDAGDMTFGSASGAITLSGGTVNLAATQTTAVNSATATLDSVLAGTGVTFTKAGTGTLVLLGANSFTGTTAVSRGTLQIGNGGTTGSLSSGTLSMGGGSLVLNNTAANQSFSTTNITPGASSVSVSAGTLNVNGLTRSVGGTVNFTNSGTLTTGTGVTNNILGGYATFGSTGWASKSGSNIITLASYTAANAGSTGGGGTTANTDIAGVSGSWGTQTIYSLRFNSASTTTLTQSNFNQTLTITTGGILVTSGVGNFVSTIRQGNLLGAPNADLIVHQHNTSNAIGLDIASYIYNNTSASGLTKSGAGNLRLSGLNAFTGNIHINDGTLEIGNAGQLGIASIAGVSTGGVANYGGTIFNAGTFRYGSSADQTLSGVISGSGGVTKDTNASSILTLTGANTYTGATTITAGTLRIGNGGNTGSLSTSSAISNTATLAFNRNDTVTQGTHFASAIGAGAGAVVQAGTGTLVLNGANLYTGATTAAAGTLRLDLATGSLSSSSPLSMTGGRFEIRGNGSGTSTQTLGAMTMAARTNSVIAVDPNNGTSTTLTLGDAWTRNVGSSLLIDYSSGNTGTREVVTAGATTGYALTNGIYGGILVRDATGVAGFATRAGGANQAISRYDDTTGSTLGTASDTGTTNFTTLNSVYSAGTLDWTAGGALTNRAVNSLTIDTTNSGGTIDMGESTNILTLTSLGILFKGPNNATLTGGQVGAAGSEVIVHQVGTGALTINSQVSSGAGSLTKGGSGALALTGLNTFTGGIAMNGGTLSLNSANRFTGDVTISAGTVQLGHARALNSTPGSENGVIFGSGSTGALAVNGQSVVVRNLTTDVLAPGAAVVQNGGATNAVLTVGNVGNQSGTFAGVIQDGSGGGTLGLTKAGTGVLTLTNANTYTGTTTINAGTLFLTGAGTLAGPVTLNGGALRIANSGTDVAVNRISDSAAFNSNGGALFFNNATGGGLAFTETVGPTTLNAGHTSMWLSGTSPTLTLTSLTKHNYAVLTVQSVGTVRALSGVPANLVATGSIVGPWANASNGTTINEYLTTNAAGNFDPLPKS